MKMDKLDFTELDNVTGGFAEENQGLPTSGMSIVCPACHTSDKDAFAGSVLYDPSIGSVEYHCRCGCKFVCYQGQVIQRQEWDALCKQKGIKYTF